MTEIKGDYDSRILNLVTENEYKIQDLETQLEISNAVKIEFEEKIGNLKTEISDCHEDRKIGDKKTKDLIKGILFCKNFCDTKLSETFNFPSGVQSEEIEKISKTISQF